MAGIVHNAECHAQWYLSGRMLRMACHCSSICSASRATPRCCTRTSVPSSAKKHTNGRPTEEIQREGIYSENSQACTGSSQYIRKVLAEAPRIGCLTVATLMCPHHSICAFRKPHAGKIRACEFVMHLCNLLGKGHARDRQSTSHRATTVFSIMFHVLPA